jgi:TRAP transporter 4TM/12TM fusion protein
MDAALTDFSPRDRFTRRWIVPALCIAMTMAAIFWSLGGPVRIGVRVYAEQILVAVLTMGLAVCFLTRRASTKTSDTAPIPLYDYALAAIAFVYGIYLTWVFPDLSQNVFFRPTEAIIVASIGLPLLLEGLRRSIGLSLIVILACMCGYALFADLFPGPLEGRGISLRRLINFTILDSAAMAGAALYIAVAVVIPFILLARLLLATGGSAFFSDLSASLMGRYRGGAGKIAIVGSALFGTISGSAVSNVASTGGITIPLMKESGYRPQTAAAIEASASTGGQLMPPIMGAAAFLLAENLGVPFTDVIIAAIVPSLLYFFSLFIFADLEAGRRGILPVEESRIPAVMKTLIRGWFLLLPFVVLLVGLFAYAMRPETAALYAVGVLFLIALVRTYEGGRIGFRDLVEALVRTGQASVEIVIICAVAGIIIGLFALSGLSFGMTFFLVQLGQTSLFLLLLMTALICIVLGMGLPTVGVYLLLATLAAPPLIQLGLLPMSAHLFVLYFGMLSMLTPPVAIAAFVAASMAGAPPMRTGFEAVRIAWPAYVVPFLFAASPSLILAGTPVENTIAFVTAAAGVSLITAAIVGFAGAILATPMRLGFALAGIVLLLPPDLLPVSGVMSAIAAVCGIGLWIASTRGARNAIAPGQ